jgi:hypothetical protein
MSSEKIIEESFIVMVNGILTPVPESQLTDEQLVYLYGKLIQQVNSYPRAVRSALAEKIMQQNGVIVTTPGVPEPKIGKKEKRGMKTIIIKDHTNVKKKTDNPKGHIL